MASQSLFPSLFPVTCHTDHIVPGGTFVAIKGFSHDGVHFIEKAIKKGAKKIVVSHDAIIPELIAHIMRKKNITLQRVADTRKALAQLSARAASYPSKKLHIIGITGTKGKTTTAYITKHILHKAGYNVALLSSVENHINDEHFRAPLTTAQPDYMQQFLKTCVKKGVTHVVMEVAAQAVSLHRVHGILFDAIIFTNVGLEHLEFYDSMENYVAAKCALFDQRKKGAPALLNADDDWCQKIIPQYQQVITFSRNKNASFLAHDITNNPVSFSLVWHKKKYTFCCPALIGDYNVSNALSAVAVALMNNIEPGAIKKALQSFSGIPGRFQKHYLPNGALCIIDYAHNPLSYAALLPVLRSLTPHLILVFGAGGHRDKNRLPLMGALAAHYADIIIVTSDNPRSEDPNLIIDDIIAGIDQKKVVIIREIDRATAIKKAYALSHKKSIIALLGKGSDEYQIIGTKKLPFSETEILAAL